MKKKLTLNEHINTLQDVESKANIQLDNVMGQAQLDSDLRDKAIEDVMSQKNKEVQDFLDREEEKEPDHTIKAEHKRLHLDESLFQEGTGSGFDADLVSDIYDVCIQHNVSSREELEDAIDWVCMRLFDNEEDYLGESIFSKKEGWQKYLSKCGIKGDYQLQDTRKLFSLKTRPKEKFSDFDKKESPLKFVFDVFYSEKNDKYLIAQRMYLNRVGWDYCSKKPMEISAEEYRKGILRDDLMDYNIYDKYAIDYTGAKYRDKTLAEGIFGQSYERILKKNGFEGYKRIRTKAPFKYQDKQRIGKEPLEFLCDVFVDKDMKNPIIIQCKTSKGNNPEYVNRIHQIKTGDADTSKGIIYSNNIKLDPSFRIAYENGKRQNKLVNESLMESTARTYDDVYQQVSDVVEKTIYDSLHGITHVVTNNVADYDDRWKGEQLPRNLVVKRASQIEELAKTEASILCQKSPKKGKLPRYAQADEERRQRLAKSKKESVNESVLSDLETYSKEMMDNLGIDEIIVDDFLEETGYTLDYIIYRESVYKEFKQWLIDNGYISANPVNEDFDTNAFEQEIEETVNYFKLTKSPLGFLVKANSNTQKLSAAAITSSRLDLSTFNPKDVDDQKLKKYRGKIVDIYNYKGNNNLIPCIVKLQKVGAIPYVVAYARDFDNLLDKFTYAVQGWVTIDMDSYDNPINEDFKDDVDHTEDVTNFDKNMIKNIEDNNDSLQKEVDEVQKDYKKYFSESRKRR